MRTFRYYPFLFLLATFLFLFDSTPSKAQDTKTLAREYEPVILKGFNFPEFGGAEINEANNDLFLYAYDASTGSWRQIPFQFDEIGSMVNDQGETETSYFIPDDGVLDDNDELSFMASDAGDRAFVWIDDLDSKNFVRYEIALADLVDSNNVKEGWAYLYRSTTLSTTFTEDYVTYIPSSDPATGEDAVQGQTYTIGGGDKGLFGSLTFPANPTLNLLDRQKIRGKSTFFLVPSFDEEDGFSFIDVKAIDGPVRVLREVTLSLIQALEFDFPFEYYRNSVLLAGQIDIPADLFFSITLLRHSLDFSANASGMRFFSNNNNNILIDGNPDTGVNTDIVFSPGINFTQVTGTPGTIVSLFSVPQGIGDEQNLFYQDEKGIGDPGDGDAYGDNGIIITGSDIEGAFPLALNIVLIENEQPSSVGSQLAQNEETPLAITVSPQDEATVPVELASFTATVRKNDVHLEWLTATETNNFGFDLERRVQGTGDWSKIAFIKGKGTTVIPARYEYVDRSLTAGTYDYRLRQVDTDGSFEYSGLLTVAVGLPQSFALHQNFPNPFNPQTEIQYQIAVAPGEAVSAKRTTLTIYNLLGEQIRTLVDKEQTPGFYSVTWDGRDQFGQEVTSGVYVYRLQSGDFVSTRKMILVR